MKARSARGRLTRAVFFLFLTLPALAGAQTPHDHAAMGSGWQFMHDGVWFGTINSQGGTRGDIELVAQNWWMGMASRHTSRGELTLTGMFSLEPATVGKSGYGEIFQVGEAYKGRPLVDRQHPHDLVMQLAAAWRIPLSDRAGFTVAGAPIGEAALGPVAFMHRSSAAENPTAPLGHHTFDSTHIAIGVVAAAFERGAWTAETSVFRGREPDDDRWDIIDFGALDSWSARVWFRRRAGKESWEFQASHGFLNEPEELEPGDLRRTAVSGSWRRDRDTGFTALTLAYGRNDRELYDADAFLAEGTHRIGRTSLYGRLEALQVETDLLLGASHGHGRLDRVVALTLGGTRDVFQPRGFELGLGADLTFYGVPDILQPTHGDRPVSFHLFFRVRPPMSAMGRMWDMRMLRGMRH